MNDDLIYEVFPFILQENLPIYGSSIRSYKNPHFF